MFAWLKYMDNQVHNCTCTSVGREQNHPWECTLDMGRTAKPNKSSISDDWRPLTGTRIQDSNTTQVQWIGT